MRTTRVRFATASLAVVLPCAALQAQAPSPCAATLAKPSVEVEVPGNPFQALPSVDGCWVYVSIPMTTNGWPAIAVLGRANGTLALKQLLQVSGNPTGMVLTHDGRMLIVAAGQRIIFIDTQLLRESSPKAVLGYLDEPGRAPRLGRIYANVTADDKTLFVADEGAQSITVIDLGKARASKYGRSSIIGRIPTGASPIALTFSPDEGLLYATSQRAPDSYGWPIECRREAGTDSTLVNPQGAIHVIDVSRARTSPSTAIVRSVPAGCNAVRLVLSPSGDRAYVTARQNNALLTFDTGRLRDDPTHALVGRVSVGTAPVGIAVVDSGRKVIVTNSNRFAGSANDRQYLTVVDATKIGTNADPVIGSIAAGAFPREMRVTPDGKTLVLTNFASKSVQAIDLTHLPLETARR